VKKESGKARWQPFCPPVIVPDSENGNDTVMILTGAKHVYWYCAGTAKVVSIDDKPNFAPVVELPAHMLEGLETGASVANNGCCLTVTEINGARISFDLMKETLRITNLGDIQVGMKLTLSARRNSVMKLAGI
jgi:hypothetical protein